MYRLAEVIYLNLIMFQEFHRIEPLTVIITSVFMRKEVKILKKIIHNFPNYSQCNLILYKMSAW